MRHRKAASQETDQPSRFLDEAAGRPISQLVALRVLNLIGQPCRGTDIMGPIASDWTKVA